MDLGLIIRVANQTWIEFKRPKYADLKACAGATLSDSRLTAVVDMWRSIYLIKGKKGDVDLRGRNVVEKTPELYGMILLDIPEAVDPAYQTEGRVRACPPLHRVLLRSTLPYTYALSAVTLHLPTPSVAIHSYRTVGVHERFRREDECS